MPSLQLVSTNEKSPAFRAETRLVVLHDNGGRAAGGTLTFAPGETSKVITVLVNGDEEISSPGSRATTCSSSARSTRTTRARRAPWPRALAR